MKYVKAFFAFWYDFIVGDAWEVAAGVIAILALLFLGGRLLSDRISSYGVVVLPLVVVALLLVSLWRARNTT